ncbi:MAG: monovalent cation/H+ antiporter subunit D family protein [Salinisphaera sp.]|nr:monovalent cation/H+ antiporter subunit D family protein [Salinisphaera sp.]
MSVHPGYLIALPMIAALVLAITNRWPRVRDAVSIVTAVLLFVGVCLLVAPVAAGARPDWILFAILPGIGLRFTVEPLGVLFALVASGLWIPTAIYAVGYMEANQEGHRARFAVCFALALAAAMGIAFAGNLVTLFLFYEALTLITYPLVTHHGDDAARRGGRVYLGLLLGTSIGLFLPAIVITWAVAGTVAFAPGGILDGSLAPAAAAGLYALYLFGVGKAALMPFHRWLPAAMVAPTPVSALLHAVAVVKAGVFVVLKITVYVFGLGYAGGFTEPMMWVAAVTVLGASIIALTRDNLKSRLAYSTISQLAYVVLGATLATTLGIVGGALHIVMHAAGKITLFFCAGAIYTAAHKTCVSELDGLGRAMPITFAAFAVAALSIVGLPPAGGTWSKWYLMLAAADAGHWVLIAVLAVSSLLSLGYLLDIPARAFFRPAPDRGTRLAEAPWTCLLPLCAPALLSILLFFMAGPIVVFVQAALPGS